MFNDYYVSSSISVQDIMEAQESVFKHFLGYTPNEMDRYYSPFREDNTPGCRFQYDHSTGIWYFIDNATYKNRLSFTCIQLVQYIENISRQEAINKIAEDVKLVKMYSEPKLFKADIRYVLQQMDDNNYFTRIYNLPLSYLKKQGVYRVKRYWCNSRKHNYLKLNSYGNPIHEEVFLYKFDSRSELYFPGKDIKYIKNTLSTDFYGQPDDNYVVLTEGKKDQMMLNYHYGLSTLGLQTAYSTPDLKQKQIFIWLDPDDAGIQNSKRLWSIYPNATIITNEQHKYDISDLYTNNKTLLNEQVEKIKSCII